MTPETVIPETCKKGDCAAETWVLTGPGKLHDLFPVTEDASVAAYPFIFFKVLY